MVSAVRHPIFARVYQRLSRLMERDIGDHRGDLLAGLSGRVLEVGPGNGMNFAHIESAGFVVERVRSFDLGPSWSHTNPRVLGLARLPRASAA
jgi:hypothetical protein